MATINISITLPMEVIRLIMNSVNVNLEAIDPPNANINIFGQQPPQPRETNPFHQSPQPRETNSFHQSPQPRETNSFQQPPQPRETNSFHQSPQPRETNSSIFGHATLSSRPDERITVETYKPSFSSPSSSSTRANVDSLFTLQSNLPSSPIRQETSNHSFQGSDQNAALRAEVARYREKNADLIERFRQLNEELKRRKIDSFEALASQDKEMKKLLVELARITPPMAMEGLNIGLVGLTSTGKSTLINSILGEKVAKTGAGETTTEMTSYRGRNFILWDVPGRNDEMTYMTMEYISFFKGLSKRLILIEATIKEISSILRLLDELDLHYAIVFNKFDKVDEDERAQIQKQIDHEIRSLGFKCVDKLFFISARNPQQFADWQQMIHYTQN